MSMSSESPSGDCFLVITVGGTPEPVVASILRWRPLRVYFVVSEDSARTVTIVLDALREGDWPLDAGRYDLVTVSDPANYSEVYNDLRNLGRDFTPRVGRNVSFVCDFTGGTKAMSAALALVAARWECTTSYVGGTERTKGGVGIVVSGSEQIAHGANPWKAFGVLESDHAEMLLDEHAFESASRLLDEIVKRVSDSGRKQELVAFAALGRALAKWDRFDHNGAANGLASIRRNDIEAVLGHKVLQQIDDLQRHCRRVADASRRVTQDLVLDLLANAKRRIDEGRWDDATARLYRAVEATAQLRLHEHGIDTGNIELGSLPSNLKIEWGGDARNGRLKIGLERAWRILAALGDESARIYEERCRPSLSVRNESILAHGFTAVKREVPERLLDGVLQLVGATAEELPRFSLA